MRPEAGHALTISAVAALLLCSTWSGVTGTSTGRVGTKTERSAESTAGDPARPKLPSANRHTRPLHGTAAPPRRSPPYPEVSEPAAVFSPVVQKGARKRPCMLLIP